MGNRAKDASRATPPWWIRGLSVTTLVATFGLIALGSAVRVTNSGMGCKGWPLCSGEVGPISRFHPLMEQSHRYLASIVTILIVVLAVGVRRASAALRHVRGPVLVSVGVIAVQIVLGAITVLTNNAPVTVALHLLVATLFLGVVTVTAVASFISPDWSWSLVRGPGRLGWSAVIALYVVVVSGSVVVNAGAQAACPSWPACFSSSAAGGLVAVQLVHRSMVLVGSVFVVVFLVGIVRGEGTDRAARTLSIAGLVLLAAQIVAGALSALNGSRMEFADVHLILASSLWSLVVAVFALTARQRPTPAAMAGDEQSLSVKGAKSASA